MIRLDAAQRRALREAQAKVDEIMDPVREAQKIERAKRRRNREQAVDRSAPGQRKPRQKDPAYLNWIRSLPCIGCGKTPRSEAAHIRAGYPDAGWRPTGMAEKPDDARTAPLCGTCHREGPKAQHAGNERAWWSARDIYPPELCADLRAAYEAGDPGETIVRRYAADARSNPPGQR